MSAKTVALLPLVVSAYVSFHLRVLECHSRCTKRSEELFAPGLLWNTSRKKRLSFIRYYLLETVYIFLNIDCYSEFDLTIVLCILEMAAVQWVLWVWYCSYSNNWIYGLQAQLGWVIWLVAHSTNTNSMLKYTF